MSLHLTIQNIDLKLFNVQSSALHRCTLQCSQNVSFHSETGPFFSTFFLPMGGFLLHHCIPIFRIFKLYYSGHKTKVSGPHRVQKFLITQGDKLVKT